MTATNPSLSRNPATHPLPTCASGRMATAQPLKVVVIDDDEMLLRLYAHQLTNWPLAVDLTCFSDGYLALEHVASHSPELLIVDWQMPRLSGSQLIASLRQAFDMGATRIVVVSSTDVESIRLDHRLGDDVEVLGKPIPFDRLLAIAHHLASTGERAA